MTCYVRTYKNRKYANDSVVPFVGHYTDKQGNTQSRFMYIYEIHCIKTNHYYIGQHTCRKGCKDPLKEYYIGSGRKLLPLKRQYDWYNDFTFTIIEFCKTAMEIAEREQYWIKLYKQRFICLNVSDHRQSPKRKPRHQAIAIREINSNSLYFNITEASKILHIPTWKISTAIKLGIEFDGYKFVVNDPNIKLPKHDKFSKPVVNLTTRKTYNSIQEAALLCNVPYINIQESIKRVKPVDGYYWIFKKDLHTSISVELQLRQQCYEMRVKKEKERVKHELYKYGNSCTSKRVQCVETGEIWPSAAECARSLGYKSPSSISLQIQRGHKAAKTGYHYRYIK